MNTYLLGWTMLHFLWLGTALLIVAAVVRLTLRRAGANVRYAHSLATLLALAALPIGIAAWLANSLPTSHPLANEQTLTLTLSQGERGPLLPLPLGEGRGEGELAQPQIIELNPDYNPNKSTQPSSSPPPSGEGLGEGEAHLANLPNHNMASSSTDTGRASGTLGQTLTYIESVVPYLPYLWLLGTPITFALLATGLIGAERMRRHGTLLTDGPVHDACERLRKSLQITRRVTLALCDRVAQPVLVGIVRPLILLPPAALDGWSPAELEMVLLHELAHVRRWDNLVNLAQRVIESLLFFHPAVWIASTWIRRDREDCCDAVVVTRTEQPKQYAELLIALASPQPLVGLALARHPLAGRLRRILKLEDEPMLVSRNTIGLLTLAVVAIALVVVSGPLRVQGEDQPVKETAASDATPLTADEGLEEKENADQPAANPQADNPLAGIAYPSPREGEIALRAFKALRLKLAPATPLESETGNRHGKPSAIKIASLSKKPHGTTLLTKIESIVIQTFDDVELALDKFQLPADESPNVRWEAISESSGEFLGLTTEGTISVGPKYVDPSLPPRIPPTVVPPGTVPGAVPVYSRVNTPNGPVFQLNPLANIAYPSPREGEIAMRAWKELKIKVAPATDEELGPTRAPDSELQAGRGYSHRGGLKLIDFNENFPDLQGTPILKELQSSAISTHIGDFDDLAKALDAIAAKKPDVVVIKGSFGGNVFTYSMAYPVTQPTGNEPNAHETITRTYHIPKIDINTPELVDLENWIMAQKIQTTPNPPHDDRVTITATEAQHERIAKVLTDVSPKPPFLSLEDQKIADRAYKLLGVELEPLKKDERSAVAKLGFEGGLRVSQSSDSGMEVGDLLVGLHVWPTKDLRALDEVLMRDDLAGLSPLKFYVVRQKMVGVPIEGREREFRNTLAGEIATGRVVVDLQELGAMKLAAQFSRGSNSNAGVPGRMVYESNADGTTVARMVYPQPVPAIGAPQVLIPPTAIGPPTTYTHGIPVTPPAGFYAPSDPNSTPSPTLSPPPLTAPPTTPWSPDWPAPSTTAPPSNQPQPTKPSAPANPPEWPSAPSTSNKSTSQPIPNANAGPPLPPIPNSVAGAPPTTFPPTTPAAPPVINQKSAISNSPPAYRYDGKTFQTWRDTWKHELSTEKRIEAVKALAAFGRAGYAKEAAETILDVAGEYDSPKPGSFGTEEFNLRTTIISSLGTLDPSVVFPKIMERTTDDPEEWTAFFASYLNNLPKGESTISKQVYSLTKHEDPKLRQAALSALLQIDSAAFNAHLSEALKDADSQVAISALLHLVQREMQQQRKPKSEQVESDRSAFPFDEVSALLLHEDPRRQSAARSIFRSSSLKPFADELAGRMLEVVRDPKREAEHPVAIRALGAMKESAIPAQSDLKKMVRDEKEDLRLRVAAAVALDQIEPQKNEGRLLLLSDVTGEEQKTRIELKNEELRELSLPVR